MRTLHIPEVHFRMKLRSWYATMWYTPTWRYATMWYTRRNLSIPLHSLCCKWWFKVCTSSKIYPIDFCIKYTQLWYLLITCARTDVFSRPLIRFQILTPYYIVFQINLHTNIAIMQDRMGDICFESLSLDPANIYVYWYGFLFFLYRRLIDA